MIFRLTAGLVCLSLTLAITPLDMAFGAPCPGASATERAPTPAETCPDAEHGGDSCPDAEHGDDSCPDDCRCLCCPGARFLHQRYAAPVPVPRIPSVYETPLSKSFNPGDFIDGVFRPPRRP